MTSDDNRYDFAMQLQNKVQTRNLDIENTLILNPVENMPPADILEPCRSNFHGLYNTDTQRDKEGKFNSKLQFSGRNLITDDISTVYEQWAELLGASELSMRLLSGLHAHTVVFMALSNIGDKVMLLPEKAGGHVSGKAILQRLGLQVFDIPIDEKNMRVDKQQCLKDISDINPDFIFIDRSEGLIYEDFSWVKEIDNCCKIFDASQYLTNIICNDYKNPFDMGFDMILSTMHKNLPGPQRALICSKEDTSQWSRLRKGISTYVSNMHFFTIYSAGLLLGHMDELRQLSSSMLKNAAVLDNELENNNIPIIHRIPLDNEPITHHCWIQPLTREKAFDLFLVLERLGILTNYRLLPYNIGYGLRLGLSGATVSGLNETTIPELARIIAEAYTNGYSTMLHKNSIDLIQEIKKAKLL